MANGLFLLASSPSRCKKKGTGNCEQGGEWSWMNYTGGTQLGLTVVLAARKLAPKLYSSSAMNKLLEVKSLATLGTGQVLPPMTDNVQTL